ncbi:NitT/TauT family transport system permease protein [Enhydrobacter aerosaccus]|uniref:NitT/TauT family transport system permease protein n=1 Tax=Enhydrobacter aerosaccus TaxID=225324 RepID=A0A1T4JKH6_9HYPH|nr:NitT/TauT family transport system permease protein [Enhydrobacter aerosaccus]
MAGRLSNSLTLRRTVPPLATALLLIGLWETMSRSGLVSPRLLPAPTLVWDTLQRSFGILLEQAVPTLTGALAGILLAAASGILLGIAVTLSRTAMQAIYPTIVFFQLIPKVALAPVFLIWFGTGMTANILFSVFIAFFPVLVATITGLDAAPDNYERLCRSLGMSRWRSLLAVRLPFALPHIFSGLRIGVTFAVIGVVLGEFITAQIGLGYIILFSANNFETALLLAAIVLLCGVGILLFAAFVALEWLVMRFYDSCVL